MNKTNKATLSDKTVNNFFIDPPVIIDLLVRRCESYLLKCGN